MNLADLMNHKLNKSGLTVAAALRDATQANQKVADLEKKVDALTEVVQKAIDAGK